MKVQCTYVALQRVVTDVIHCKCCLKPASSLLMTEAPRIHNDGWTCMFLAGLCSVCTDSPHAASGTI